jgi:hypothetical protein
MGMSNIEFYALHANKNNDMDSLLCAKNLSGLDISALYFICLDIEMLNDIRNHTIAYTLKVLHDTTS